MLTFGLIGLGHWGPNYARLLGGSVSGATLVGCVDRSPDRIERIRDQYPMVHFYTDYTEMITSDRPDAVIVATPASAHRQIVEDCLDAGMHVLVEKPIAGTTTDSQAMVDRAHAVGRTLMVGHTFLFNPAVRRIKQYLDEGELGQVRYLYFHRTGLGPIRQDVNALWDLAPHDLSMLRYWLGSDPIDVVARGASYLRENCEDVVFLTLRYPGNVIASIHVSWLDPVKVRRATIVGDRKMAIFDDVHTTEKLRLYDKGASYQPTGADFAEFVAAVRDGDIVIPSLENKEPLREQLLHFIECIETGAEPISTGADGIAIVQTLERAQFELMSLRQERVDLQPPSLTAI